MMRGLVLTTGTYRVMSTSKALSIQRIGCTFKSWNFNEPLIARLSLQKPNSQFSVCRLYTFYTRLLSWNNWTTQKHGALL